MADRFHFNPETGRTGKCGAEVQCRFGQSESQHGASREDARANYEATMAPELFSNTASKVPAAEEPQSFADTLRGAAELARQKEVYRRGDAPAAPVAPAPAAPLPPIGGGFGGGSRMDRLRAEADEKWRQENAAKKAAAAQPAGLRMNPLRSAQDEKNRREVAAANAAARRPANKPLTGDVPPPRFAPAATGKPLARFSGAQLDAEASEFRAESGYSVGDLVRMRQVTESDAADADRNYDGYVTVKIPSGSELTISSELVRRELKSSPRGW